MKFMSVALALLAAGCALAVATPPEVEVADVELRGLGLLDQALGVTLCVSNPNTTELSFRSVTVALEVANAPLAEGASERPVRLPPMASVLVPFTARTTARNLGPQLWDVVRSGGVAYRLRGSVQLDGPLGISLPFSRTGRLGLLAAGARLLGVQGQLDLPAKGTRLLADNGSGRVRHALQQGSGVLMPCGQHACGLDGSIPVGSLPGRGGPDAWNGRDRRPARSGGPPQLATS